MAGTTARYLASYIAESVQQNDGADHALLSKTILRLLILPDDVEEGKLATALQIAVGNRLPPL